MRDPPARKEFFRAIAFLAVPISIVALLASYITKDRFGDVALYVGLPVLLGALIFFGLWAVRLFLRGQLPTDIGPLIPNALQPVMIWWVLLRISSFAAMLLIFVGTAIGGLGISTGVHAFIYVVFFDIAAKIVGGIYLNALILWQVDPLKS